MKLALPPTLERLVARKHGDEKVLVFTQYSDTARYIKAYYDLLCEKKCVCALLNAAQTRPMTKATPTAAGKYRSPVAGFLPVARTGNSSSALSPPSSCPLPSQSPTWAP